MKWNELDLVAKTWVLPASRTKNGRAHVVPLPPTAVKLLKRLRTEVAETEPRVFPGLTPWTVDLRALSKIHNGAYEWKDLRRTHDRDLKKASAKWQALPSCGSPR
jgi:integrase